MSANKWRRVSAVMFKLQQDESVPETREVLTDQVLIVTRTYLTSSSSNGRSARNRPFTASRGDD